MTSEQLDELERLARAASRGPWEWYAGTTLLSPDAQVLAIDLPEFICDEDKAYLAAANPDAVLALIARVRGLEAEPVFRDVSEMEPPDGGSGPAFGQSGMAYWRERALAAEAERDRLAARVDKAEDHAQQVSTFASKMIGHACERHADTIQKMSFNEFYSALPRSCHWCADERVTALEAERDEWRALTITPRGAQYYIDKAAQAEADRDRLAAEVERLWALLHSGAWHRRDGRTYLAIRLADGADLSCRATREDAIRAALAEVPTREESPDA